MARRPGARAESAPPVRARAASILESAAGVALSVLLAGTALAVDARAEAAFDAPKRFVALVCAATAALALAIAHALRAGTAPARARWAVRHTIVALVAAALLAATVAAVGARHRAGALDTLRVVLVMASLAVIGASRALDGRSGAALAVTFLAAAALNAAVAVAQAFGVTPFAVEAIAGRVDTGALIGNEGHLAQLLALALVAATALVVTTARPLVRRPALVLIVVYAAGIVATRNVTAVVTAWAGVTTVLVLVYRRGAGRPLAIAVLAVALAVAATPPLRGRLVEATRDARAGAWDAVVTYRLGPWAAALDMIRAHPLLGVGPGTFGAEFVPHRLAAEIRFGRRFTIPLLTSTFAEAHSDYLQLAAETGLPAAVCATVAMVLLFVGLGGAGRRHAPPAPHATAARAVSAPVGAHAPEAIVLTGVLVTAALMALAWFPMQRPASAAPILLALGRGWRLLTPDAADAGTPLSAGGRPGAHPRSAVARGVRTMHRWGPLLLAALLVSAVVPELARYRAERELRTLTSATQLMLVDPSRVRAPVRTLATIDAATVRIAPALVGDSRPWILAGSALLVSGDADGALERYGHALTLGERAEIVLNMGRAFALRGDGTRALAAFTRAVWVSPPLLNAVSDDRVAEVRAAADAAAARLASGTLDAPPPLP